MNRINSISAEYLQTIEGLDNILAQLDKFDDYTLSIDNFLTFATKKANDTIYPRRKKNNTQYKSSVGIDKLYRIDLSLQ